MSKRMLIDGTHAEETRVVVLDGNRLEDFDLETSTKQQLKGNIYLAKVVRVEPSLQAAFVEYGGNRHGFLAFSEIHPDYYQIPVADRKRLLEAQEAEAREAEEAEERADRGRPHPADEAEHEALPHEAEAASDEPAWAPADISGDVLPHPDDLRTAPETSAAEPDSSFPEPHAGPEPATDADLALPRPEQITQPAAIAQDILVAPEEAGALFPPAPPRAERAAEAEEPGADMAPEAPEPAGLGDQPEHPELGFERTQADAEFDTLPPEPPPEQLGGELDVEEHTERRAPPRFLRNYKIQEVIRRRQILLVQVVKEERGTKGAALTTYISLAGRFSVLMPNSPRGGGISRKITSPVDRRRLKEVTAELDLPRGMGLIVRTAGANRPKPEILRDCEYLLSQWDQIRELTMKSMAPALIYEEASLIKRAIRDVYSRDVDEILVDGEQGWRAARDFMRMLMPTHARKVQLWKDPQPLFAKMQVESQLDAMLSPTVQLRSGGYLVINQTEALVAIDVNSGRSTRERGIEETALRTNVEAAEEVARQLRLRDLAGLIVIDFIDMENRRNVATVERRLKDALRHDRARIQIGSISHFGLLEMSRQRLRPSLNETNFITCPHCGGTGHVRSTESAALHVLRQIEEEGGKRRAAEIVVHCDGRIALYILNHKRLRLAEIEARHGLTVIFNADDSLAPPAVRIERLRAQIPSELPRPIQQIAPAEPFEDLDEIEPEAEAEADEPDEQEGAEPSAATETAEERERRRGRRRRRRRGRRDDALTGPEAQPDPASDASEPIDIGSLGAEPAEAGPAEPAGEDAAEAPAPESEDADRPRRRRGGRRRRREPKEDEPLGAGAEPGLDEVPGPLADEPAPIPVYAGPTPADPFSGPSAFDLFEAIEQAEQERAAPARAAPPRASEPREPEPAASEPAVPEPAVPGPGGQIAAAELTAAAPAEHPAPELSTQSQPEPHAAEEQATPPPEPEPQAAAQHAAPEPPPPAPAIMPVLVGAEAGPAEKKRGWWRR